ncbi:lipoprotein signal peptidase [Hymenobacter sp. BT186]|uniref:Lipoprotein signal peptidase n=1 Tax=Hymenobacter telluris TaxID=2816474 RepID=A0A939EXN0_9BACT|nr:lipoprotein signal peptidase [Hymenobacter telluris]MBO0359729.1 lipoprotein signal peptidase [Hymenobacter telluris]MBW3375756.1 lipoprotein signal peptidase [Hymenobacter norwichensis]
MKYWKYYLVALLVIFIDQLSKWAVHHYMQPGMGGEIPVFGDWFKLHYTTNPGMAFGFELPPPYGKIVLTVFRLIAVSGISYYIYRLWKQRAPAGLLVCIALILGGAIGNLVDSIFYGVVYGPALTVYGAPTPWLHGQVIDMLFVDFPDGFFPTSWPLVGGNPIPDFPIFNIADSSIFIGVVLILLNQTRFYGHHYQEQEAQPLAAEDEAAAQARHDAEAREVV